MNKSLLRILLSAMLLLTAVSAIQAQDMGPVNRLAYFLADDAADVQQVYQILLDGQSEPRQITNAAEDVQVFGTSYDGLGIAYVSSGQLWIQSTHSIDAVEAVAEVSGERIFIEPVFSVNGDYVAYQNDGVWLLDLATREERQILADVELAADGSNMPEYRIYMPQRFVLGPDGTDSHLIVDIGVWEWNSAGIYNIETGELQALEGQDHTDVRVLYGHRALIYGNSGIAGLPAVRLADSFEDINTSAEVVNFGSMSEAPLFAEQAVELSPGTVRILGSTFGLTPDTLAVFTLDIDLMNNQVGELNVIALPGDINAFVGQLSPDGALLPVYVNAQAAENGDIFGQIVLVDVVTGEVVPTVGLPERVTGFVFQQ